MKVEIGTLIKQFKPFVSVLSNEHREQRCESCFERFTQLRRCTVCKVLKYCSQKCQRNDWAVHKTECKCLAKAFPEIPLTSVRMMLRLIIKTMGKDDIVEEESTMWKRQFSDLMSHVKEIKADSQRCEQFSKIQHTLVKITEDILQLPSASEMLEIFGKMTTNCFSICGGEMETVGVGLYLGASVLDHSCIPDASVTFRGPFLCLHATRSMEISQPSDILISYIDLLHDSTERMANLRKQYYFECTCPACKQHLKDDVRGCIRCSTPTCHGYCPHSVSGKSFLPCAECHQPHKSDMAEVERFQTDCHHCLQDIKAAKDKEDHRFIIDTCKKCVDRNKKYLHPSSLLYTKLMDAALDAYIDDEEWTKALQCGLQTLEPYKMFYPSYSAVVGIQLMKVGKLQLYLEKLTDALHSLQQAESVMVVTHGKEHRLYQELGELLFQTREEMRQQMELAS